MAKLSNLITWLWWLWASFLIAVVVAAQAHQEFGWRNMFRLEPFSQRVGLWICDVATAVGLDSTSVAEYLTNDLLHDVMYVNALTPQLYVVGIWALVTWILAEILRTLLDFIQRHTLPSAAESSESIDLDQQYGDMGMLLLLIGIVLAVGAQVLLEQVWLSAAILVVFIILAVQRYLNRQRLERFKTAQLYALNKAIRGLNRTEVAKVHAMVSNELNEQRRMTGKLWVSAPATLPLQTVMSEVEISQAHVDSSHEPREMLALELERLRVKNQYDYAEHVRQIKELAITNHQRRWELLTREVTELRKVMVAVYEEIARNPALQPSLNEMLMRMNTFQNFMEEMREQGHMDNTKTGRMMDELFTRTFEANIDDLLRPKGSNGHHAHARN